VPPGVARRNGDAAGCVPAAVSRTVVYRDGEAVR
jgi:hypothetical protein